MVNYSELINTQIKTANDKAVLEGASSFTSDSGSVNMISNAYNNVTQSGIATVTHAEDTLDKRITQVYELIPATDNIVNTSLDFDLIDADQFIQEDTVSGTEFVGGMVKLKRSTGSGGIYLPIATCIGKGAITQATTHSDFCISADGTKVYVADKITDKIHQYALSTAWDITTISYTNKSYDIVDVEGIVINEDGTIVLVATTNTTPDRIKRLNLSTPWDISTATTEVTYYTMGTQGEAVTSVELWANADGTRLYSVSISTDIISQYTLTTPWDLSTITFIGAFNANSIDGGVVAFCLSNDGTTLFIGGNLSLYVYQCVLTTPWDITTAVYGLISLPVGKYVSSVASLFLNSDSNILYVSDSTTVDAIAQLNLVPSIAPTTFSPLTKGASVVLSNGNLTANVPDNDIVTTLLSVTTGKYYCEIHCDQASATYDSFVGIVSTDAVLNNNLMSSVTATSATCLDAQNSAIYVGAAVVKTGTAIFGTGSTVGLAIDADNKQVTYYINGVFEYTATFTKNAPYFVAVSGRDNKPLTTLTANFGGSPFTYSVPDGYTAGFLGIPYLYTVDVCIDGTKAFGNGEVYGTNTPAKAFDNIRGGHSNGTSWYWYQSILPAILGYDFGAGNEKIIVRYTLTGISNTYADMLPKDWTFQASNDSTDGITNGTWITLDTRTGEPSSYSQIKAYTFSNTTAYRWYRLNITACNRNATTNDTLQISEVEMLELNMGYTIIPKYVTTSDDNQINLAHVVQINSLAIDTLKPSDTSLGCLVSFDGRVTWKNWNGSSFVTHPGIANTAGWNTTTELETALANYYVTTEPFLDFAFLFNTSNSTVTPSLDQVTLNYDEYGFYTLKMNSDYTITNTSSTTTKIVKTSAGSSNVKVNTILP
jgi:hypothetical protein